MDLLYHHANFDRAGTLHCLLGRLAVKKFNVCHGYISENSWKEPVYPHHTYCTYISQWSEQYSNVPHRNRTLLYQISNWALGGCSTYSQPLTLFFVTPLLPLSCYFGAAWHFISASKMHGSIQAFFSEIFVDLTTVYIIFSHPRET